MITSPANVEFTGLGIHMDMLDEETDPELLIKGYQDGQEVESTTISADHEEGTSIWTFSIGQYSDPGVRFVPVQATGLMNGEEIVLWPRQ